MPAEIVFTSVPRGLDGGSGTQPVRRTKDMNPALAERLKLVSGYSHPFPERDRRNPVVYFHRIERVAGGTYHVLARMCDAGNDHTGRSNYLGHLLAVESSTANGKGAGPAAVALEYGFKPEWSGVPEEVSPPVIVGCSEAEPARCAAWADAGLDEGIAGDLADAAMRGEEVNLVTPANQPDPKFVLRLFADALRLVEPARRWRVTFNTCEIEPFDATWRAIRADLPQAREMRARGGRLIDLTAGARGSDGPYALFARGQAQSLPWQPKALVGASHDDSVSPPASIKLGGPVDLAAARRPPPPRLRGLHRESPSDTGHRRRLREPDSSGSQRRRGPSSMAVGSTAAACLLVLGFVSVWIVGPWRPPPQPVEVPLASPGPVNADAHAAAARPGADYVRRKREKDLRKRLEQPADGRTVAAIRADVEALRREIEAARTGPEPLTIGRGLPDAPDAVLAGVLEACRSVQARLDDEAATDRELEEALRSLAAAEAGLPRARSAFERLRDDERRKLADERLRKQEAQRRSDRQKAYEAFRKLATHAVLPPPEMPGDLDASDGRQGTAPIDLGALPHANLIEPVFRLAVPRDEINGHPFVARIHQPDPAQPEWFVELVEQEMEGALDEGASRPRPLARLYVEADRLKVALTDEPNGSRPQSLLRRCVLLIGTSHRSNDAEGEGREPPEASDGRAHEIRFVEPTRVGPVRIDPFAGSRTLEVPVPPGITTQCEGEALKLPIASCEFRGRMAGREIRRELAKAPADKPASGVIEDTVPLAALGPEAELILGVKFTFAAATLRVEPRIDGRRANAFPPREIIKEKFLEDPEKKRDRVTKAWWEQIRQSPGMKPGLMPSNLDPQRLNGWFATPFAIPQKMGVLVPGHETIEKSLDLFFKHEYGEAKEKLDRRREGGDQGVPDRPYEPNSFEEWKKRDLLGEPDQQRWKKNFQDTINRWWSWFKPQFEAAWDKVAGGVRDALEAAGRADCRIEEIASLAYDEAGTVYRVPLVVFGDEQPPAAANEGDPGDLP